MADADDDSSIETIDDAGLPPLQRRNRDDRNDPPPGGPPGAGALNPARVFNPLLFGLVPLPRGNGNAPPQNVPLPGGPPGAGAFNPAAFNPGFFGCGALGGPINHHRDMLHSPGMPVAESSLFNPIQPTFLTMSPPEIAAARASPDGRLPLNLVFPSTVNRYNDTDRTFLESAEFIADLAERV